MKYLTSALHRFVSGGRRSAILVLCFVVAAGAYAAVRAAGQGTKHGVAYFDSVTSVYPQDKIRILGVEVGTIDKITPQADQVRVEFSYSGKYMLPAEVKAAIVSPTLVATRYIQLTPAYEGGDALPDGGTIPASRTVSPLEFDNLKSELNRLSKTLGPNDADAQGSLARFLASSAAVGKGQGQNFNTMVHNLAGALSTLSEGRGDLFATLRNLQVFVSAVAAMDTQVADFNRELGGVSDLLDDNSTSLVTAIRKVNNAAAQVNTFVKENRGEIVKATDKLTDLTENLAGRRDELATLLHVGPNTATNFYNIFSWRMKSFTGGLMVDNLNTPGELACALIANQFAQQGKAETGCMSILGDVLNQVKIAQPPVGFGGVTSGGGEYDSPAVGSDDPDVSAYPDDPNSSLFGQVGGMDDLPQQSDDGGLMSLLLGGAR